MGVVAEPLFFAWILITVKEVNVILTTARSIYLKTINVFNTNDSRPLGTRFAFLL